jgi:hypothetical protein
MPTMLRFVGALLSMRCAKRTCGNGWLAFTQEFGLDTKVRGLRASKWGQSDSASKQVQKTHNAGDLKKNRIIKLLSYVIYTGFSAVNKWKSLTGIQGSMGDQSFWLLLAGC